MTIKEIQQIVGTTPDGIMGPKTKAAIAAYQQKLGVTPDGIWGPKTQAAYEVSLQPKQSFPTNMSKPSTANMTSATTLQPVDSRATTTTTATKPTVTTVSSNLTVGSRGDAVKDLQLFLRDTGVAPNMAVDGIFGPETKAAVMAFQKANGLVVDGIVGPKTKSKIYDVQNSGEPIKTPIEKQIEDSEIDMTDLTPEEQEVAKVAMEMVTSGTLGQINTKTFIDEETAARFLEQAKNLVAPVYKEKINNILAETRRSIEAKKANRERNLEQQAQQFKQNLGGARENYAGSGLAFSGQRGLGERNMLEAENKDLAYQDLLYGNELSGMARQAEEKVGAQNMGGLKLPTYSSARATLSGASGGYTPMNNLSLGYTPGSFQYGEIPEAQKVEAARKGQEFITQANTLLGQGRDYKSLFI